MKAINCWCCVYEDMRDLLSYMSSYMTTIIYGADNDWEKKTAAVVTCSFLLDKGQDPSFPPSFFNHP